MIGRRRCSLLVIVPACAVLVSGCGAVVGWRLGLFNSDGRFDAVDACEILPDAATLAPLVRNGARESGDSKPEGLMGLGRDDRSECKWSSVPKGVDRPFRTVRVFADTKYATVERTGPERAADALEIWHGSRVRRGSPMTPVNLGEKGYRTTDQATYGILTARIEVFDIHAKFRISNVVVDVSARTHERPGEEERARVEGLAKDVAAELKAE